MKFVFRYAYIFCGYVRPSVSGVGGRGGGGGKLCWAVSACPFCVGLTVLAGVVAAPYMTLADGPPPTYVRCNHRLFCLRRSH